MTNFERWQLYMREIPSPQSYIDFGFYYLISAALQRRVWVGPDHYKLYPNVYIILVGEPGIGKGLVIKQIAELLKYHKLEPPGGSVKQEPNLQKVEPALIEAVNAANYAEATGVKTQKIDLDRPLLIPVAADATTYEALIRAMAKATRRINYVDFDPALQKDTVKIYTHSSLCFCLEEISSLFRRKTEDVVNFLLKAYDCGDYEYDTKTQGTDRVKRCCLNFFGGTTPSFMQSTFNDRLLNEGFSSRTWFVFEYANRFNSLLIPELSEEQVEARNTLIEHVQKLSKIYGRIHFEQDAWDYLDNWWKNIHPYNKPNTSLKLTPYYARKNIHAQKLAVAMHMGEDAEVNDRGEPKNKIQLATVKSAMEYLDLTEKKMHYAINFDNKNPLSAVGKRLVTYITNNGAQSMRDLMIEFWDDVRENELKEIIQHLIAVQKIALFKFQEKEQSVMKYDVLQRGAEEIKARERVSF